MSSQIITATTFDPCGTPESASGCASCPLNISGECPGLDTIPGPTDEILRTLESLSTLEERLAYLDEVDPGGVPLEALAFLGFEVAE